MADKAPDMSGPAFPATWDQWSNADGGMSLRDWFAGQALAGICGDGIPGSHHAPRETARDAYAYADAMLKAREAGQ
ncbi:hypothetical protein [Marinicauda sp. Alg238-R41]|uniref:hypothetical protein n=1 Tax=Marinicauda sp. Alg238-R41 TaxID=2993447 RepID=UPI0022E756D5|nr:hypothetical protein [Marinicauda sp. Alg238-R41]